MEAGSAGERYLVVIFSSARPPAYGWSYNYEITAGGASLAATGEERHKKVEPARRGYAELDPEDIRALAPYGRLFREFERKKREEVENILERPKSLQEEEKDSNRFKAKADALIDRASFKVLRSVDAPITEPSSYIIVTADLWFEGPHTRLYVDTTTTPTNLTREEAEGLGRAFDERIYDTNREAFGVESDINGDGKVAILMSPAVNRLTDPGTAGTQGFIAGYFLPTDLLPHLVPAGATNAMEIFYTVVPDPTGEYGNVFTKEKVLPVIEGVLSHEFLHMILFNYRALIYGRGISGEYLEDLWLEEGLAHIAEDVNDYDASNIARAKRFLADPGNVTLIYGGDSLEERGASYLFLRLLGDRFGSSIFKALVQSKKTGVSNIESATGQFFMELFADWSAALYLSGRGITDDPRFNYTSIDLPGDFGAPYVATGAFATMQGFVQSMAPEYIRYDLPASSRIEFEIGGDYSGSFNAVVVRLQ